MGDVLIVELADITPKLNVAFEHINNVSDGGYEAGYRTGYDGGYKDGYTTGLDTGYDTGKQAGYDNFWDSYQNEGNRTDYAYAYYGAGWSDELYQPKYPMRPVNARGMFAYSNISRIPELDLSECTTARDCFRGMPEITELGVIDLRNNTAVETVFTSCEKLVKIEKVIFGGKNTTYTSNFTGDRALTSVTFAGEISSYFDTSHCPLDADSVRSLIETLADLTGKETQIVKLSAVAKSNLTDELREMIANKNWTLS